MRTTAQAFVAILSLTLGVAPCGAFTALEVKQASDQRAWENVQGAGQPCDSSKTPDLTCALQAISLASQQCSADAKFFQRQRSGLSTLSLVLILISAGFTGVGASSTIANAKIYSTLGGTTGIGAATTSINSDVSSDQSSLTQISTDIGKLTTLASTYNPADSSSAAKILLEAPTIAADCDAAAATSSAASKKST
jgi:hypothetical protein